jgi:hypothetical protein
MGRSPTTRLVIVGLLALWAPGGHAGTAATEADEPRRALMIEAEEGLVCQCGCGLTVHACNHLNCPSGIPIKEEIARRVADGQTTEEILAYFRGRYGEKILSAPPMEGFNLVAWVAPGVFVVAGVLLVTVVARRWSRQRGGEAAVDSESPPPATAGTDATDPARARLAREIEEFDG